MKTSKPESSGGRVVVLTVLGLILLFGGLYVAAYAFAGDKIPRGTSVAGVDIGGQTRAEAAETLERGFADRRRLAARIGDQTTRVRADEVGLDVDVEASVEQAGASGRSWEPEDLWTYYTAGDDVDPVLTWDETAFEKTMDRLDQEFGTPPREGRVRFVKGQVKDRPGRAGELLDRDAAREALAAAYTEDERAELELVAAPPEIDAADVQQALNEFANPAVSGPVRLAFDDNRVQLTPADYSPALAMVPKGGALVPELREKRLKQIVDARFSATDGAPVDATVRLVNGRPKVIPSRPGVSYEIEDISDAFLRVVAAAPGRRELQVQATVQRPDFTTKDARRLRIKERVSTFTTYYPHAEYRNVNLGRAAELVSGTVLKPGETFSLNETVGERTAENGFTKGFIISDGVYKEEFGGGVSQMATTLFNAMFFAGLEDVEHRPHSFYIDRYPVGREATVVWGALDLKFRNNTKHGVLISASVQPSTPSSAGAVTVSMWSTKTWDITTRTGRRHNFTDPETRTLSGPDCVPNEGYRGFDIDVWRFFSRPGSDEIVRREKFETTYSPSDTVRCEDE